MATLAEKRTLTEKQKEILATFEKELVEAHKVVWGQQATYGALCEEASKSVVIHRKDMARHLLLFFIATVFLLVLFAFIVWKIMMGDVADAMIAAGASLADSALGFWFWKLRTDSRDAHAAALALLAKYNCP